jgi:hypothetical protein
VADFGASFFPPLGPATGQPVINPQGWDRCVIQDQVVPGFCRILSASCRLKMDPKPKNGADGDNPTLRGMESQPLQLEIVTYNDADREALAILLSPYIPQPGQTPKPVSIDHPSLRMIRISAVQIIGAGALIPEHGTTKARMVIDLHHWLPSKQRNATATPRGAPVRKNQNNRQTAQQKNPPPTQQKGFAAPPARLGNGQ